MTVPCVHVERLHKYMLSNRLQVDQSADYGANVNVVCHECKRTVPIEGDYWPATTIASTTAARRASANRE